MPFEALQRGEALRVRMANLAASAERRSLHRRGVVANLDRRLWLERRVRGKSRDQLRPPKRVAGGTADVDYDLDLAGQTDRLEGVGRLSCRERRADDDRGCAVGGVAQPCRPEVLPLCPDDPELGAVRLDCKRELFRAGSGDRELLSELARTQ